jgi:hypothetical protein
MSAIGPKRTCIAALHMSAFGGKADMAKRKYPLLQSQIGSKADMTCCAAYVCFWHEGEPVALDAEGMPANNG